DAFHEAAPTGARLFYAVYTQEWADEFVPVMNRFDVFRPGTPPVVAREELAIAYRLPPDLLALKLRALQEHVSQVEGMVAAFGEDFMGRAMAEESFRLAAVK
ncbi:MAG: hypothetical protein QOI81_2247, partial [Actinomycetota bacterium]|nr:hypothetical protein [Actinomycetota bacterium]